VREFHKIQTVWLRDPETRFKTLLAGEWALPEFEYLRNNQWAFTEKVDGTNIRVMWDGERVTFGGRTDKAQIPAQLVTRLQELFPAERMVEVFDGPACLYGEGHGAGIQKVGSNYSPHQEFALFDILVGNWWLQQHDVRDVAKKLGCVVVPFVGLGTLDEMVSFVQDGLRSEWGPFPAEGIVARPVVELAGRDGKRIITKLKAKDFSG
jgi:hypothetical protein